MYKTFWCEDCGCKFEVLKDENESSQIQHQCECPYCGGVCNKLIFCQNIRFV